MPPPTGHGLEECVAHISSSDAECAAIIGHILLKVIFFLHISLILSTFYLGMWVWVVK